MHEELFTFHKSFKVYLQNRRKFISAGRSDLVEETLLRSSGFIILLTIIHIKEKYIYFVITVYSKLLCTVIYKGFCWQT